jgi:fructose-1,6-bisphosphatase II
MELNEQLLRNIGLDIVRVTETTALASGRFLGSGEYEASHLAATRAMYAALSTLPMDGRVVIGEEKGYEYEMLKSGQRVGNGEGPRLDVVVDPIDGTNLLIRGQPGAVSVVGISAPDTIWSPEPARYLEKIVVDKKTAPALVPECMDAPAAWTLALIARQKEKSVRDLSVIVLDRERNADLVREIREAGARVLLRVDGDAEGAMIAATVDTDVDALMGIGGATQGILSACVVKSVGGEMLARIAPQSAEERGQIVDAGLDFRRIMRTEDMVKGRQIFFAVTGITATAMLEPMHFYRNYATTHSMLIRAETGTRRFILAEHAMRV